MGSYYIIIFVLKLDPSLYYIKIILDRPHRMSSFVFFLSLISTFYLYCISFFSLSIFLSAEKLHANANFKFANKKYDVQCKQNIQAKTRLKYIQLMSHLKKSITPNVFFVCNQKKKNVFIVRF